MEPTPGVVKSEFKGDSRGLSDDHITKVVLEKFSV